MVLSNDTVVSKLTPERCVTACGKAGKRYAGITQGTQCHCSNDSPDVDKVTDDAACYYPCEGDKALKCGSNLYFSVYYAPGQYDFPLALSVTSASEAFERVKITVTPNYGSLVMLNFGDGTVIYTKNSSIEYVYTTLGLHEVLFCIRAEFIESGIQDVYFNRNWFRERRSKSLRRTNQQKFSVLNALTPGNSRHHFFSISRSRETTYGAHFPTYEAILIAFSPIFELYDFASRFQRIERTRITHYFVYVDGECHGRYQTRLKKANENDSGRHRCSVLIN